MHRRIARLGLVGMLIILCIGLTLPFNATSGGTPAPATGTPVAAPLFWEGPSPHLHMPASNADGHHHSGPIPNTSGKPYEPFQVTGAQPCINGLSAGLYPCDKVELLARMALNNFSSNPGATSNLWGYVDLDDNREYALIGLEDGTAVVDITNPLAPDEIGAVPAISSIWRELKVYQFYNATQSRWDAYAYVTTESAQGLQIIDLTDLPNSVSLAAAYNGISTAHTVFISNLDPATNVALPGLTPYLYLNGSNLGLGGMRILSLANPTAPVEVGSWEQSYMHDIQVLTIDDDRCPIGHRPCEIVLGWRGSNGGSNQGGFSIIDATDKANVTTLSRLVYPQYGYAHSGWMSADLQYVFGMDELDNLNRVRVFDVSSFITPTLAGAWNSLVAAIEHNGYTVGNKYYISHYRRGLTVLDVATPTLPTQVAFFDTYPASNGVAFNGAWGVYPYLPSGNLIISDIEGGLFVVREAPNGDPATPTATVTSTATSTPTPSATPTSTATATPPTGIRVYFPFIRQ